MAIREAGYTQKNKSAKKTKEVSSSKQKSDKKTERLPDQAHTKGKKTSKTFQNKFQAVVDLILRHDPNVTEERNSNTKPLDLLILLILNQSTTDELSDRAFAQLKKDYPDYQQMLKENDPKKVTHSIKICGLAPTKAGYILNTLHFLNQRGWLDIEMKFIKKMTDQEALATLTQIKGVGVKSVSCLLMFAFGRGTFPIDTHLFRVFKRIGQIIPEKASSEQAHKLIQPQIDGDKSFTVHVSLINLGRTICKAPQEPLCEQCFLRPICDYAN